MAHVQVVDEDHTLPDDCLTDRDLVYLERVHIRSSAYAILMALYFHTNPTVKTLTMNEFGELSSPYFAGHTLIERFTHKSDGTSGLQVSSWHEGIKTLERHHDLVLRHKGSGVHRFELTAAGKEFVKQLFQKRSDDIVNKYTEDLGPERCLDLRDVKEAKRFLTKEESKPRSTGTASPKTTKSSSRKRSLDDYFTVTPSPRRFRAEKDKS